MYSKPETAIETLPYCLDIVPNAKLLLKIFAALPVTTATFSALRRLKTYLRSTMTENRPYGYGLALININRKEIISEDKIAEDFAKKAPRRLQVVIYN